MSVISLKYCGRKEATEINIYSFLFVKNIYHLKKTNDYVKMENTILTGDRQIGFRLAYLFHEPERGDIVIFKYSDDESRY